MRVVVPDVGRKKRPFAFGADATRRMNRDAFAPKAFGERGPDFDELGWLIVGKPDWVGSAVKGAFVRPKRRGFSVFDLVRARAAPFDGCASLVSR